MRKKSFPRRDPVPLFQNESSCKKFYENEQAEHISMLVVSHEGKRKLGNGLLMI